MKKKYKISLITLFATVLAALLIAVCLLTVRPAAVYAADRYVTIDGTNVFYTSIRGAEITSAMETEIIDGGGETPDKEVTHYYTLFKIGKDETVAYRKSLAYRWYSGNEFLDKKENPTGEYKEYFFSMKIGFESLNFSKYIIAFQSQQYLKTEDKITKNYLVFTPDEEIEGAVSIAAVQDIEKDIKAEDYTDRCDAAKIEIAFQSFENGTVKISINGTDTRLQFENVYFPYANYISSGDTAVTPLTFSAQFEDDAKPAEGEDELTADMKLYELNGQSFELFANDKDEVYNDVKDNAPPVICFTQTPSYVQFGKTIDFNYQVIDVLASSPRSTACFYVLTGEQYEADDFNYMWTEYDAEAGDDEDEENKGWTYPFIKVSSGSDIRVIRDANTFVPYQYLEDYDGNEDYSEDYSVYGLIKVYYEISDVTGSTAKTDKVFVDWYAKDSAKINIFTDGYKGETDDAALKSTGNFLKIIDGKQGATYASGMELSADEYKQTIVELQRTYQDRIDKAIADLEEDGTGKLYAGGDSNFYLPAFADLVFGDEYFNLQDYKFSIYYKGKATGTNLSLNYNNLSIPLSDADVTYRFTIFITDAFNNPMRYPDRDDDGKLIWKEITTDDIWDEDFALLLPFFEFNVSYKKATAENPKSLSVAYVGTSYSGVSFDIKDSAKTSSAKYSLYIFDRNGAYKDLGLDLTYEKFVENYEKLFGNTYNANMNTRKYFTTVRPASKLVETDENYDLFKAINWNANNVTFTPQSAEDFYVVRLTLTDSRSQTKDTFFATVAASIQANPLKGEDDWLENNIAAVVLLSVAGVLFIIFIVLLVVKPKDKGDIDEIYENDKKNKKKKAKSN